MGKTLVFCFLLSLCANAVNSEELNEGQTGEETGSESDNSGAQHLQQQKDQLLGLLAQVDERYGDVSASLKSIEQEIAKGNQSLDKIRKEIGAYQGQIDKLGAELSGQVRAAYAMGQQSKLKLMLNQQDPALSSRIMVYYEYLNKSRLEKLVNLQQTVRYLDQLDEQKKTETEALERNLGQKRAEQTALAEARNERNRLIARLTGDFSSEQDQLNFLEESEHKLIKLIQTLENEEDLADHSGENTGFEVGETSIKDGFPKLGGDFASLKGKLPLPVKGKLTGMTANSISENNWKGVLIDAKEGAEIKSVSTGTVVYSGILKGYGLMVIVEHDNGFMTLYAFNQSVYKHKGDHVEAGEVIASVGQSGGRIKPGLYFEIRKNGKPIDPLLWCRN